MTCLTSTPTIRRKISQKCLHHDGEGHGRLFTTGLNDAPLPIHYEPAESPVANLLYPKATYNPVSQRFYKDHTWNRCERANYPYVITTYRVVSTTSPGL
jgi:formate dehydrogenase major subunit